jgi:epoxyqueuosine reductase QueG
LLRQPVDENIFEYIFSHWDIKIRIEEEAKKYKQRILTKQYGFENGPLAERKKDLDNPKENTDLIKKMALDLGADMVGISKVKQEYFFKGSELDHRFAISMAMEMDYDRIQESPGPPSATEVIKIYCLLGEITIKLASKIRKMGYPAYAHHPRASRKTHARILHIPTAIEAGLGELGRHGLLITPKYGPRVRLGTVSTNLPLITDSPVSFGVSQFCDNCDICVKECEGDAIPKNKSDVQGFYKYKVDPFKCGPYFAEYDGCSVCMKVCAYNKKLE